MVAPALPQMATGLFISNAILSQMMLSIFILAYAIGPLFLGPLSEVYGRVPVLQLANLFFLIFNLVCGFARTEAQMLVFRFLAGLGGSAPLSKYMCSRHLLAYHGVRSVDRLPPRHWRRHLSGLLPPREPGQSHCDLLARSPHWARRGPDSRRLHRRQYLLAMGLLDRLDRGCRHSDIGSVLPAGDVGAQVAGAEGTEAEEGDRERAPVCGDVLETAPAQKAPNQPSTPLRSSLHPTHCHCLSLVHGIYLARHPNVMPYPDSER